MAGSIKSFSLAIAMAAAATPSAAAVTDWLSPKQINGVMRSWGGAMYGTPPKFYATAIDCKDDGKGLRFRMTYTALSGPKPFHRWNWVHAKSADLAKAVSKLKVSDEKHLRYRVVQKSSYVSPKGVEMTCAIAYR
jgi:hypothetical protein